MLWYQRSLSAFLLAFGVALLGLILGEIGQWATRREAVLSGQWLFYGGYAALAAAVPVCLYSLYAGIRAWVSERQLCWWSVVPVLVIAAFLHQLVLILKA